MTITSPTDPIEASGDLDGIVTRSVHNGFRCENFRHNIYTFEMHKPNPRPFSLLKGKTHTHYFESEQDSMSSHFYAKGPVFGSFEKMQAANQRRQANFPGTEWPFPVYRWVWFGSTDDSGVMHFGIPMENETADRRLRGRSLAEVVERIFPNIMRWSSRCSA